MNLDSLIRDVPPFEQRLRRPLSEHWFDRLDRHFSDSYAGVPLLKFPEDLRVYEHLLWDMHADVAIEIGAETAVAPCSSGSTCDVAALPAGYAADGRCRSTSTWGGLVATSKR